jgi:hypothetical protein
MSILSDLPDGAGFWYGFVKGDSRRIDVRQETGHWAAWVAGTRIAAGRTKAEAESMAISWMKQHPEPTVPEPAND